MIIAVANQKGGVGKTTLAVHLAAWLARRDRRVVLVDGDAQGNATSWLLDGDTGDPGFFRLLAMEEPPKKVLRIVNDERWGSIGLIPGNAKTKEAMTSLLTTGKPFDTADRAFRPLAQIADCVLVDMPPGQPAGFREMLFAADGVVIPTQLERLSLEGLNLTIRICAELRRQWGRGPRLLAIVPNMVRKTVEHREQFKTLVEAYGPTVWPPIPLSTKVAEACSFGQALFDYAPDDPATKAMAQVARRLYECTSMKRVRSVA